MKMVFCEFANNGETQQNENQSKKSIVPVTSNADISKSSTSNPTENVDIIWNNNFPKIEILINKIDNQSLIGMILISFVTQIAFQSKLNKKLCIKYIFKKKIKVKFWTLTERRRQKTRMEKAICTKMGMENAWLQLI